MKHFIHVIFFSLCACFLLPMSAALADDTPYGEKDWERGFEFRIGAAPQITMIDTSFCNKFHYSAPSLRILPECDYLMNTKEIGIQSFIEIGYRWPHVGIYWQHGINRSYIFDIKTDDPRYEAVVKRTPGLYYHTSLQVRGLIDVYENLEFVIGGGLGLWRSILPNEYSPEAEHPEREVPGLLLPISLTAGLQWHFTDNMTLSFEFTYSGAISLFGQGVVQVIQPAILWGYTL